MKKTTFTLLLFCFTLMLQAQVSKTINITPGGLSSALTFQEKSSIIKLTVFGSMDARDFYAIKNELFNWAKLRVLDLTNVTIANYRGVLKSNLVLIKEYPSNTIPPSIINSCTNLNSINLPLSLKVIDYNALNGSNDLSTITIPYGVTTIGNCAFTRCSNLTSVNIPSSVISIGYQAFAECPILNSIVIPISATSLGNKLFYNSYGLKSVSILSPITSIGESFFGYCSNLTNVELPSTITFIGEKAFNNCHSLESLSIPLSVISIGINAFSGCNKLAKIDIPPSVSSIQDYAFSDCSSAIKLMIPASVSSIGQGAFSGCTNLTSIYSYSKTPIDLSNSPNTFEDIDNANCTLYVPFGSKDRYSVSSQWSNFSNIIEMGELTVFPDSIYFTPITENSTIVEITTDSSWTISSDQLWLRFNSAADSGNYSLNIVAEANPDDSIRTANVTVHSGGGYPHIIKVSQSPKPELSSSTDSITIGCEAGTFSGLEVNSNTIWNAISDQPWIKVNTDGWIGNGKLIFISSSNNANVDRSATITLSAIDADTIFIKVSQKAYSPYLLVSKNQLYAASIEVRKDTVEVMSNVSWKASSDQVWLTISSDTSAVGNNTLIITADLNPSIATRSAMLTVESEGLEPQYITVTQEACVTMKTVNLSAGGLSVALTEEEKNTISVLTITGTIDARDFKTLGGNFPKLAVLDLSNSTIVTYTGSGGTYGTRTYPANTIPIQAFYNRYMEEGKSSLLKVILPNTLTSIAHTSFKECANLICVIIPNSVTSIGVDAFMSCTNLSKINIPTALTTIESNVFIGCRFSNIVIPPSVTSIKSSAFAGCINLKEIIIPNSVISMGYGVFMNCISLKQVSLSKNIVNLQDNIFDRCYSLDSVSFPPSVKSIGSYTFNECENLKSVYLPKTIITIGASSFCKCFNLKSIILPDSLKTIEQSLFAGCINLETVTIPLAVTNINTSAFFGCINLTEINIPDSVSHIGSHAFNNCYKLKNVVLPNSITIIDDFTFNQCDSLIFIKFPKFCEAINWLAFGDCKSLTSISLPASIKVIEDRAFEGCFNLQNFYNFSISPESINVNYNAYGISSSANIIYASCNLLVPFNFKSIYQSLPVWKNFENIIEMPGISLSEDTIKIASACGSSDSVYISSNTTWAAASNQNWLTVTPTTGIGNDTLIFTAKGNPTTATRTAMIIISGDSIESDTITVIQDASTVPTIPFLTEVNDTTIINLESACFNAYDTITVAGGVSIVEFLSGSSVNLIAGSSVILLPGFHAYEGSYTHAYITTDGTFCDGAPGTPMVSQPVEKSVADEIIAEKQGLTPSGKSIKVFPNPNNGQFTLELTNINDGATVCIYNMLGARVYYSKATDQQSYKVNMPEIKRGIYFVKVQEGKEQFTRKMVVD
jgi:hypothetical protein